MISNLYACSRPRPYDAAYRPSVALSGVLIAIAALSPLRCTAAESSLAVINAAISSSEDGPPVSSEYHFSPGDYLYLSFEIAGFSIHADSKGETRAISLVYQVAPQDAAGKPLAEPVSDEIKSELHPEDKNWVPKRRASFLLPPFLAAGPFRIRITVQDLFGKTESSRGLPFSVGGVEVQPALSLNVQGFRFLRSENDTEALGVAAYSPGDTVYARFEMTGFRVAPDNRHHVAYGVTVLDPNGKAFIQDPHAADLESSGFYPAQFIPGNIALRIGKTNARGRYTIVLKARDLLANQDFQVKQTFSLE